LKVNISKSWKELLESEFEKKYFDNLVDFVKNQYRKYRCFPPGNLIFSAFDNCDFRNIKVVIIGQDPYHGLGQANGLCFSVNKKIISPPSLQNILIEMSTDLNCTKRTNGDFIDLAKQGVMLLNSVLTVRENNPASHANKGWEIFTDNVIKVISEKKDNIVFMLWGNYAKKKRFLINKSKHLILESGHPSPLSANRGLWFGNKHFSKSNKFLTEKGLDPIKWV
tara:strand:+ start:1985 stop:2653 length:669 start_codon:yes stop_codon:yes gene_type:complete